ncbi:MAG: hypothetical protein FJX77_16990, partial [Armatimonadetes bacterium]|nr:hypothetical protein [Armatimonadota bacterium]
MRSLPLLVLTLPLAWLSGCGDPNPDGAAAPPVAAGAPKPLASAPGSGGSAGGGTLTVATADDLKSLDTALAFDTWSTAVVHACTRRLVDYDAQGKLVPDLAEAWEISDGGKSYRFRLRPDGKYADGAPIEASHFQAAVDRIRRPDSRSPGAGFYSGIAEVSAPNPATLIVKLK